MKRYTLEELLKKEGIECTKLLDFFDCLVGTTPKGNRFVCGEAGCDGYFYLNIDGQKKKHRLKVNTLIKQIKAN